MKDKNIEKLIKECLIDYVGPIFICDDFNVSNNDLITTISATIPREELVILDNNYPLWYRRVLERANQTSNILCITDFDQISTEEQKLFLDIICENCISGEKLPDNLKIVISSNTMCPLIEDIREVVEYIKA